VRYSELSVANELTSDASALTPVMRQYFAAKEQYPDCLMFCRIGDFYELFYEDAILVARELQLTLTARDKEKKQPMCGVPYHAAEGYLQRLLRMGYKIALCEQMEDPKQTKTIVRREVTRVLTPGTALDPSLGAEQSNYLASVASAGAAWGLALLDLSTGEFRATEFAGANGWTQVVDELGRVRPVELVYAQGGLLGAVTGATAGPSTSLRFAQDDNREMPWTIRTRHIIQLSKASFWFPVFRF
jgi:DNA mismatch repair protein MutS